MQFTLYIYIPLTLILTFIVSSYVQEGLTTIPVQVAFLNNLIVIDGILLGLFSVLVARDFEEGKPMSQRQTDLIALFLFLVSLLGSMVGISRSAMILDASILSALFAGMMYGILLVLQRLLLMTFVFKRAAKANHS